MDYNLLEKINLAKCRDKEAIAFLYETYYKDVYYVCLKILKDEGTAADITQEAFLKAFEQLDSLNEPEKFKSWICQIANRMSLNYIKRSKIIEFENIDANDNVQNIPDEAAKTPEELSVDRDVAQVLLKAIEKLPDDQRICVFMYYYQNMSIKEIAMQMGSTENTIRGKLRYANSNLRKYIENFEEDGIKLRCIGVLPFLYLIFQTEFHANSVTVPAQGASVLIGEMGVTGKLSSVGGMTARKVTGSTAVATKTGLSIGAIIGIITGTVVVSTIIIIGIVAGINNNPKVKDETYDLKEKLQTESVSDVEENTSSDNYTDVTTYYEVIAASEPIIFGKYFYYYDENVGYYVIKDIETSEVIKAMSQGVTKYKDCKEAVIFLCEKDEYMDVVVLDKSGKYLMSDTAYIGGADLEFDYGYFIREYAIDDLILSKEGHFVYLSYEGNGYVLKSFNLINGTTNYEIKMPKGVICAKNENYVVYNDKENAVIKILNITDGGVINAFPRSDFSLDYVRLLDEYYAVCTTENGYITNYRCFDCSGQEIVSRNFDETEKVSFFNTPGVEVATGMNILPLQKEGTGEIQKGLFRYDLTPIVDFDAKNAEYELHYQNGYLGRHSKVHAWSDYSYKGMVFLNNGETIIEANQFLDSLYDMFIAMNYGETNTVINPENGCYFEIPSTADIIKLDEHYNNSYAFLVIDDNNYEVYDKNGKFLFTANVPIYDKVFGKQTISYMEKGNYYIYNNIEEENNTIYLFSISEGSLRKIDTVQAVYCSFIKDEENVIYSTKDGDVYQYILKNISTGEEQKLFNSECGIIYGTNEYGFIIGDERDDLYDVVVY